MHDLIEQHAYSFRWPHEIIPLAQTIADKCPHTDITLIGLQELFINALEHGNLNINHSEKTKFLRTGEWHKELHHRILRPENSNKMVKVSYKKSYSHIEINISDQGQGFDWQTYLKNKKTTPGQRKSFGLDIVQQFFKNIQYHDPGNSVTIRIPIPGRQTH